MLAQVQRPPSGCCASPVGSISVVWLQVWQSHRLLNEGIASGEVQPLPWTVYSRDKAQDAFRFLAGGGRLLFCFSCCSIAVARSCQPAPKSSHTLASVLQLHGIAVSAVSSQSMHVGLC